MPRVRANGLELYYEESGRGEPLILVMGLGAQLIHWHEDFIVALEDRGYRVIRFDNRDVGFSTHLDDLGVPPVRRDVLRALAALPVEAPYTLSDMAGDTVGLIDALGIDRAHVLGVSLGGMIAQTLAIEYPERVHTLTSIMSTPGGLRYGVGRPNVIRTLLGRPPKTPAEAEELAVRFSRVTGSVAFDRDEERVRRVAACAFERARNPKGFARQLSAALASGTRRRGLPGVTAPSLVIHGTHDRLIPPSGGRATAKLIPGARLRMVEGMGHDLPRGAWPLILDAVSSVTLG